MMEFLMFNRKNNFMQFPSLYSRNTPQPGFDQIAPWYIHQQQQMMSPSNYPGENFSIAPGAPLPADQTSQLETVPRYARGGHVRNMNDLVDYVRMQGQRADKVLAHINPAEAAELDYKYGSDINPITGLPQFGKKSQPREAQVAQNMRTWEGSEKNKNIRMTELANLVSKRSAGGISQQVILDAMKNPANMATLLNLTVIPTDQALAMANGLAPASWDDYGGEIPKGAFGNERSMFSTILKHIPTVGAAAIGSALGGPLGAIPAASLAGTTTRGGGNKLKGAATGAGIGATYAALAPMAASAAGATAETTAGKLAGLHKASLLSQLGFSSAPTTGGGIGLWGNAKAMGLLDQGGPGLSSLWTGKAAAGGTGAGSALAAGGSGIAASQLMSNSKEDSDLLGKGLLAASILGTLGRREKIPYETPLEENYVKHWKDEDMPFDVEMEKMNVIIPPEDTVGEKMYFDVVNPAFKRKRIYADGGYVFGETNGQSDKIPAMLSDGEFVFKAPVVAAIGGGNNNAGGKILSELQGKIMRMASRKGFLPKGRTFHDILMIAAKR